MQAAVVPFAPRRSVARYLALGATNTAVTFALFTGLQHVTAVAIAYTVAFATGLVITTTLSSRVVFGARTTRPRQAAFACCYLAIYAAGLGLSQLLAGHAPPWQVSSAAILVTAPLGYLAGRTVLVPRPRETRRSP